MEINILEYILQEKLQIVAVLLAIGAIMKHALPMIQDRAIPIILVVLSFAFCVATDLLASVFSMTTIYQSVFVAAQAIGVHQIAKKVTNSDI